MNSDAQNLINDYRKIHQASCDSPEKFWQEQADKISWFKAPSSITSTDNNGITNWFADAELNTSYLALDQHIENGIGDQKALIWDSPVTKQKKTYTFLELRDEVAKVAGGLKALGVSKGDRVMIYLPAIPEAVIAMLACARLGAIHSVVFGGFAPAELASRINDANPKAVITSSCGIEFERIIPYLPMVRESLKLADSTKKPTITVVLQREQYHQDLISGELDWGDVFDNATPAEPEVVKGSDPLYILYTSGTTGKPKGVVRDNAGHAVALNYSMPWVYDAQQGDVFWAASDVGWVVGHSYIVYAPLMFGCTTIIFEGKPVRTPDAGTFWRVCEEYGVNHLFAAPTAFRAIKKEDPEGKLAKDYDLASLKRIFMAGERLDPATLEWTESILNKSVIDHWWQTETGWSIVCNPLGSGQVPTKPGSSGLPVPGYEVVILDDKGDQLGVNQQGYIAIKLPMPPSCLTTVWGDHSRFTESYLKEFDGYYATGDGGYIDEDGYVFIMGRVDDVINVAGHRLSTGELEAIAGEHPAVAECAVFGVHDELRGEIPLGLVILKDSVQIEPKVLEKELVNLVRQKLGAVACFRKAYIVPRLPKTRSGKILRRSLRQIANGDPYDIPNTIDDPAILEEINDIFQNARDSKN